MFSEVGGASRQWVPVAVPAVQDDWRSASLYDLLLNLAAANLYTGKRPTCVRISPAKLRSLAHLQAIEGTNSSGWRVVVDTPEPPPQSPQSVIREIKRLSGLTWENIADLIGVSTRSVHLWRSGGQMAETKRQRAGSLLSFLKFIDRGYGEANRALILDTSDAGRTVLEFLIGGEYERAKMIIGAGQSRPPSFASTSSEARYYTVPDQFGQALEAYGSDEFEDIEPPMTLGKRRVAARRKGA